MRCLFQRRLDPVDIHRFRCLQNLRKDPAREIRIRIPEFSVLFGGSVLVGTNLTKYLFIMGVCGD